MYVDILNYRRGKHKNFTRKKTFLHYQSSL